MNMIRVFKTSVQSKAHVEKIMPLLNQLTAPSGKWNFDLDDCDRILRVEYEKLSVKDLIEKMQLEGFTCEELED